MVSIALGALSGALLVLAFPAAGLAALAWVALVPLFLAVRREASARAAVVGLASGLVFQTFLGWWLLPAGVAPAAYAAGAFVCALYSAGFGAGASWLHRRAPAWSALTFPALWALAEWARANAGWLAAPWGLLGTTQLEASPIAGIAAVAGVWGISFSVAAGNAVLTEILAPRLRGASRRPPISAPGVPHLAPALALLAPLLLGLAAQGSAAPFGARHLRVAVLQAGVYDPARESPDEARGIFERYLALSRKAALAGAELIVWPESSVPVPLPADREALGALARLARTLRVPLLVSTTGRDKRSPGAKSPRANSALLFTAAGRLGGRHDKIRLLPFNEHLPLRGWIAWPRWIAPPMVDAVPGSKRTVFVVNGARFAVLLCWENLFSGEARSAAAERVDFLVSMTNEDFTPSPTGRKQLFQANALRAVEVGLPIVRAATTGISAIVSPSGATLARVESAHEKALGVVGFAVADVPLGGRPTFFLRRGDWLVALATLVTGGAVLSGRCGAAPRPSP